MKTILQIDPNISIESHLINKSDIVLVFKDNKPIGYVHQDKDTFIINCNYFNDDLLSGENVLEEEQIFPHIYTNLTTLMSWYPDLQFKLID